MSDPVEVRFTYSVQDMGNGERVLYVQPDIPDNAPADMKEGLARRRIVNTGGVCPCGARFVAPNRAERRRAKGRVIHIEVEHEPDCPATLSRYMTVREWLL